MGWWATKRPGEIMGDDVADEIGAAFQFFRDVPDSKPTFQQLIDATAGVVHDDGDAFLSDASAVRGKRIAAVFESPAPTLVSRPNTSADGLQHFLGRLFRKIAGYYLDTEYRRKPRLTEVLDGLAFVLRPRPQEVIRDAEGLTLVEFRVEESGEQAS